jgi:hypothetical protein
MARDPGFGLNYSSGFNSGPSFMPDVGAVASVMNAKTAADAGLKRAEIEAEAAKYPYELKQQRFQQIFPWLQNQLSGMWAQGPARAGGGQIGTQPTISASPIWDQSQIQQQVNSQRAANDAATAGRIRSIEQSTAGRGYGAGSPLAMALGQMAQNQNLMTNTQNEQQTRWNAAQGNARQVLAGQQAQEAQFAARQQEDIERRKPYFGTLNALIGALGGLA